VNSEYPDFTITMRFSVAILVSSLAASVRAHAYVWGIKINNEPQGRGDADGAYIRKIFNNDPVKDLQSPDMTCNRNKGVAKKTLDLKGGDNSKFLKISSYRVTHSDSNDYLGT
jgi:hypothetical protein